MYRGAEPVIEETPPTPTAIVAQGVLSMVGVALAAGGFGFFLAGIAGAVAGLVGAAAFADHTIRRLRRELAAGGEGQTVYHIDWAAAPSDARSAVQPAVVRRWVGPRPGSAVEQSRWMVAGRDPRQIAFELTGRRATGPR